MQKEELSEIFKVGKGKKKKTQNTSTEQYVQ